MNKEERKTQRRLQIFLCIWLAFIALLIQVLPAEAASIHRSPENIALSFTVTRETPSYNQSVIVTFTSNEQEIIDNVEMSSEYLQDFNPKESILEPLAGKNFTLEIGIDGIYENITISTDINVTGEINGVRVLLTQIPLQITVTAHVEQLRDYIYRKCFIENGEEYCSMINISDLQNVTIYNITHENYTVNVMLPFETSKAFFSNYDKSLQSTVEEMKRIADSVREQTNKTMMLQEQENRNFENAFILEAHLKKIGNPLWFELAPQNTLLNLTNLKPQQFAEAMSVLFTQGKVVQRFEDEWQTKMFPSGGMMTNMIKKTYIASADRLGESQRSSVSYNMIALAMAAVIISVTLVSLYEFRWKNKPGWG